jgi:phosphoglycolate phosphatase
MITLAIFDLDGTLLDTPRAITATFAAACVRLGVPAPDAAVIRATIGLPLDEAFRRLLGVPRQDARVAAGVQHYQDLFNTRVLPMAADLVFPGVAEGLAALRARGLTLAVATSKVHASADAVLMTTRLRDAFRLVVGADEVAQPKPSPEMGLVIMRRLGATADRTIMVGDTTHDLAMARAAGMRSVGVTYGVHSVQELQAQSPTWVADTFAEVVRLIETGLPRPGATRPPTYGGIP